jgi:putative ABC transport system substrate-binding protein
MNSFFEHHKGSIRWHRRAVYELREYVVAGGLMSYGTNFADQFHQFGVCTGSIFKGVNPAEPPVRQSDQIRVRHQPEDR